MANTRRVLDVAVIWLSLALTLVGCSRGDRSSTRGGMVGVISAQVPTFLNGPMDLLLTNASGFDARVEVQGDSAFAHNTTGQLLCRGSKLLFAPDPGSDSSIKIGGFIFIWDVSEGRGLVLSESLQGYAPVSTGLRATNLLLQAASGGAQQFDGHPCQPHDAVVRMNDGATAAFRALCASDLNGLPVQITSRNTPLTLALSHVRFEAPPLDLFSPPDGFSKYSSPEAMADELASRRRNYRRSGHDEPGMFMPSSPDPNRRY
jgi:hypothetical protein